MPVIKRRPAPPPQEEDLIGKLVDELNSPGDKGQPLILQLPVGSTDQFNVYVIRDRWASVPAWSRADIIYKAHHRFDSSTAGKIPVASGYTTGEAIVEGLLPTRIDPIPSQEGRFAADALRAAMIEEGAIEVAGRLQLRFPTLEDSQETFNRLQERFPGGFRFVEEQPALMD